MPDSSKQVSILRPNFWQKYSLKELTYPEWEALCDGCGMCCLVKFLDEGEPQENVAYTDVSCKLLDCNTGWCSRYPNRHEFVPDCITLTYDNIADMMWLPNTCAYKRLYNGLPLPEWHFLVTGDRELTQIYMQLEGVGAANRCISELHMSDDEIEERIVNWVSI